MRDNSKDISLRDLQTWMKWIITDPRGVNDALAEPAPVVEKYQSRYTEPSVSALKFISPQPPISRADRLGIYAEAYFARIVESLEIDFSRVRQILGKFRFQKLVAEYLKEHPSQTFNIGEVGKNLSEFILKHNNTEDIPFLAELADLEWQLIEVFYASDDREFDSGDLSRLTGEDWPNLTLHINSSARTMSSPWPLDEFLSIAESADTTSIRRTEIDAFFLLWCQEGHVRLSKISSLEAFALDCFKEGQNLSQTLDNISERFNDGDDTNNLATDVMGLFSGWVRHGLIAGLQIK